MIRPHESSKKDKPTMFLHQLVNPDGNEVVVHKHSGLIKVLASSGAVFDAMPLFIGDTSTIALASELLMQDCWEIASPETAEQAHRAWVLQRKLRMREAFVNQNERVAASQSAQRTAVAARDIDVGMPVLASDLAPTRGSHLRLVHSAEPE